MAPVSMNAATKKSEGGIHVSRGVVEQNCHLPQHSSEEVKRPLLG
jgi:hypothetical protein